MFTVRAVCTLLLIAALASQLALAQSSQGFAKSYVGKAFLLRERGSEDTTVKVKKDDLTRFKGSCDHAVEVADEKYSKDTFQFDVVQIGTVVNINGQSLCPHSAAHTSKILISGFTGQETQTELADAIGQVLMSPEAFLLSHGVTPVPAIEDPREPAQPAAGAGISTPPRALLMVNAGYPEGERLAGGGGAVKVNTTIGRDGKLYDFEIASGGNSAFGAAAIVVLSLWRYQPALDGNGQPFATHTSITTTFFLKP